MKAPLGKLTIAAAVGSPFPAELDAAFDRRNLVLETIRTVEDACRVETVSLLPADIGLTVGIESGSVYVAGTPAGANDVAVRAGHLGIEYFSPGPSGTKP